MRVEENLKDASVSLNRCISAKRKGSGEKGMLHCTKDSDISKKGGGKVKKKSRIKQEINLKKKILRKLCTGVAVQTQIISTRKRQQETTVPFFCRNAVFLSRFTFFCIFLKILFVCDSGYCPAFCLIQNLESFCEILAILV